MYQHPDLYYLHGDHLGAATFVTNSQGDATQFFLNLPFGETMLEQMDGSYNNPYKFNAKELDEDTGLYYYGARYYNPRLSIWYGVDPLAIFNPVMEKQFYGDGEHNGGVYNIGNLNPYIYCYQNPVNYIDPNGKQVGAWEIPLAAYYVVGAVITGIAAYKVSQAASKVEFSRPVEHPVLRETIPATSPKITKEQIFRDKQESLKVETYPAAKKDKLVIKGFPAAIQNKITILSANDGKARKVPIPCISGKKALKRLLVGQKQLEKTLC
jgi:RHS repeat-associated protein